MSDYCPNCESRMVRLVTDESGMKIKACLCCDWEDEPYVPSLGDRAWDRAKDEREYPEGGR